MGQPTGVKASDLLDFLAGAPASVVLVSMHPLHSFSPAAARRLAHAFPDAALAQVDLRDLLTNGGSAVPAFHPGQVVDGVPHWCDVLPGYCLFRNGRMRAWDAGLPTREDLASLVRGAALGLVCWGATGRAEWVPRALRAAADEAAADRMARRFARAEDVAPAGSGEPEGDGGGRDRPGDSLLWAYHTLGLRPTASTADVREAWRRLRIVHHPDRSGEDGAEFARRSRASADVNRARDIILGHHATRARGAA